MPSGDRFGRMQRPGGRSQLCHVGERRFAVMTNHLTEEPVRAR
jgi:hypothetical protein